jgi:hypothetical protein
MSVRVSYAQLVAEGQTLLERLLQARTSNHFTDGIRVESLDSARRILERLLRSLHDNQLPEASERFPQLARLVTDEWPLGCSLGKELTEWERRYRNLKLFGPAEPVNEDETPGRRN